MTNTTAPHPAGWLAQLRAAGARRAEAWSRRRTGVDGTTIVLGRRRVYILPTGLGVTYACMLFAMLLAGLNYGNNLALILTFVLTATGWVAMHECHRNLLGLRVVLGQTHSPFAGDPAGFTYLLADDAGRARYDITIRLGAASSSTLSVAASSVATATLEHETRARGRLHVTRLRLESSFPLGLCRAWSWLNVEQSCAVYPRPSATAPHPTGGPERAGTGQARPQHGDDDWSGLRGYRAGDALRRVAWKAYARSGDLLVKEMQRDSTAPLVYDWDAVPGVSSEERLAGLARLVVDAATRGEAYGLRVPHVLVPPERGPDHRHRCLTVLADYGAPVAAGGHDGE